MKFNNTNTNNTNKVNLGTNRINNLSNLASKMVLNNNIENTTIPTNSPPTAASIIKKTMNHQQKYTIKNQTIVLCENELSEKNSSIIRDSPFTHQQEQTQEKNPQEEISFQQHHERDENFLVDFSSSMASMTNINRISASEKTDDAKNLINDWRNFTNVRKQNNIGVISKKFLSTSNNVFTSSEFSNGDCVGVNETVQQQQLHQYNVNRNVRFSLNIQEEKCNFVIIKTNDTPKHNNIDKPHELLKPKAGQQREHEVLSGSNNRSRYSTFGSSRENIGDGELLIDVKKLVSKISLVPIGCLAEN